MYPCVCCGGPCVLCNMSIKLWTGQLKSFSEHPDAQFVDMYCSYLPFACIPCFAPCILAHVTLKKQERDAKNAKIKEILKLRAEDNPADATKAEFKVELTGKSMVELDETLAVYQKLKDVKLKAIEMKNKEDIRKLLLDAVKEKCTTMEEVLKLTEYLNSLDMTGLKKLADEPTESLLTKLLGYAGGAAGIIAIVNPAFSPVAAGLTLAKEISSDRDKAKNNS
jgi:hypothetical protein